MLRLWQTEERQNLCLSSAGFVRKLSSRSFVVNTDAHLNATGAVLLQEHSDGLHPVAFQSAKYNPAERNYGAGWKLTYKLAELKHKLWHYSICQSFSVTNPYLKNGYLVGLFPLYTSSNSMNLTIVSLVGITTCKAER